MGRLATYSRPADNSRKPQEKQQQQHEDHMLLLSSDEGDWGVIAQGERVL
jgi:hypothetical protein